jgi:riboflavin transporter FmnP
MEEESKWFHFDPFFRPAFSCRAFLFSTPLSRNQWEDTMKKLTVKKLTTIALLGAIATMLMFLRFPLPFMPPFMDFNLSGIPEIFGVFLMGPEAGVFIVLIKCLLKIALSGTGSAFTGELQNFILSCAYILAAGILFKRNRTRKSFLTGMLLGTVISAILAVFTNMYIIIPFYVKMYGMTMDEIIEMTRAVNRFVDSEWKFVALGVIPFNLIKCGVTTLLAYMMYPVMARITRRESGHAV